MWNRNTSLLQQSHAQVFMQRQPSLLLLLHLKPMIIEYSWTSTKYLKEEKKKKNKKYNSVVKKCPLYLGLKKVYIS